MTDEEQADKQVAEVVVPQQTVEVRLEVLSHLHRFHHFPDVVNQGNDVENYLHRAIKDHAERLGLTVGRFEVEWEVRVRTQAAKMPEQALSHLDPEDPDHAEEIQRVKDDFANLMQEVTARGSAHAYEGRFPLALSAESVEAQQSEALADLAKVEEQQMQEVVYCGHGVDCPGQGPDCWPDETVKPEPACDGSGTCPAALHTHGCYADVDGAACTDPGDHESPPPE